MLRNQVSKTATTGLTANNDVCNPPRQAPATLANTWGFAASPEYRSRLVVAETKFRTIDPQNKAAVFGCALEAIRMLCSLAVSSGAPSHVCAKDADVVMLFLDEHIRMSK